MASPWILLGAAVVVSAMPRMAAMEKRFICSFIALFVVDSF